jgi:hypothetical protein
MEPLLYCANGEWGERVVIALRTPGTVVRKEDRLRIIPFAVAWARTIVLTVREPRSARFTVMSLAPWLGPLARGSCPLTYSREPD